MFVSLNWVNIGFGNDLSPGCPQPMPGRMLFGQQGPREKLHNIVDIFPLPQCVNQWTKKVYGMVPCAYKLDE